MHDLKIILVIIEKRPKKLLEKIAVSLTPSRNLISFIEGLVSEGILPGRSPKYKEIQSNRTKFALLSFYSPRSPFHSNPDEPTIAGIGARPVLLEKENGGKEGIPAAIEADVKAMEDAIAVAKRNADVVIVAFHFHWVSHSRAYPLPDKVPPNQSLVVHRAIDAGADIIHQRHPQLRRPPNVSVFDLTDPEEEFEAIIARLTINEKKIKKIELIPLTLDLEGARFGCPRLAEDKRGKEIIELLQRLSQPYKTKINYKDWYGIVELP